MERAFERTLNRIAKIYDTRRQVVTKHQRYWTSTHARHNLEGAIIDIEHAKGQCDKVSLRTLKRVAEQLAKIEKLLPLER